MSDAGVSPSMVETYKRKVDAVMLELYAIDWQDAAGDVEPLQRAIEAGETPEEFVRWWGEKYGMCPK